jgi:hypothetical protein
MSTLRIQSKRNIIVAFGLIITILCVSIVASSYREQRELDSIQTLLKKYWMIACIRANTSSTGEFVTEFDKLVAYGDLTPEEAAEFSEHIIAVENLSNASTSTWPLAHSKEIFGGRKAVIKISGEILMMSEQELQLSIQRTAVEWNKWSRGFDWANDPGRAWVAVRVGTRGQLWRIAEALRGEWCGPAWLGGRLILIKRIPANGQYPNLSIMLRIPLPPRVIEVNARSAYRSVTLGNLDNGSACIWIKAVKTGNPAAMSRRLLKVMAGNDKMVGPYWAIRDCPDEWVKIAPITFSSEMHR